MTKTITVAQLTNISKKFPNEVLKEAKIFLQRGLSEYKRVAVQTSPLKVGQTGGGVPRDTGNLRERHRTKITGLEGRFGVVDSAVPYAKYVHGNKENPVKVKGKNIKTRPWLQYARIKADGAVKRHYTKFLDNLFNFIKQ